MDFANYYPPPKMHFFCPEMHLSYAVDARKETEGLIIKSASGIIRISLYHLEF